MISASSASKQWQKQFLSHSQNDHTKANSKQCYLFQFWMRVSWAFPVPVSYQNRRLLFFLLLHRLFCSISILLDSLLLQAFAWGGKYVSVDMGHSHKYFHVHDSAVWKCVQALILYHAHSLCGFVTVVYLHLSHFDFVYLCKPLYCVIVFYYYIWIGMLLYRECLSTFQSFCMVLKGLPWRVILFKPRQSVVSYM